MSHDTNEELDSILVVVHVFSSNVEPLYEDNYFKYVWLILVQHFPVWCLKLT